MNRNDSGAVRAPQAHSSPVMAHEGELRATASRLQEQLLRWLIDDACPLWSTQGVDRVQGGFHERLDGTLPLDESRRARVQPRQVSALSNAAALGWNEKRVDNELYRARRVLVEWRLREAKEGEDE